MNKLLLSLLLVGVVLSACSPVKTEFEQNKDRWTQANLPHYRFQLSIGCFCPFYEHMPLTIEVKDGEIVAMTAANGAEIVNEKEMYNEVGTIDRLFDKLEAALEDADEIKVEYDATYGFPTSIAIDYIKLAMDDETVYTVSNFEVLK